MAFARDSEFAKNFQRDEIANLAYAAAERPFSESIMRNPDAALALQLQRMETQTPLPPIIDEDSERVAYQIQEEEDFEREQHDEFVAHSLAEEEARTNGRNPMRNRVSHLEEALEDMQRDSPSPRSQMNFSRSVRGPSIIGTPGLSVFGPSNVTDNFPNDYDIDGENEEQSILPRPRQSQRILPRQIDVLEEGREPTNGRRRRPENHYLPPMLGQLRRPDQLRARGREQRHNDNPFREQVQHRPVFRGLIRNRRDNHIHNHQANNDIDLDDYEALWELQERNGEVRNKGLSPQQIGRIPHHKFKPKPGLNTSGTSDKTKCLICLCEYNDGDNVKTLPCFHSYHKICIDKWLMKQAVCPVCRENIRTN